MTDPTNKSRDMPYGQKPLAESDLPDELLGSDPNEGDENGPFLVRNDDGIVLDRREYCKWLAPRHGDGYSD